MFSLTCLGDIDAGLVIGINLGDVDTGLGDVDASLGSWC